MRPVSHEKITVFLADDHPIARAGVRTILSEASDIEIVGEADCVDEAQKMIAQLQPNILLLDLDLPRPTPAELLRLTRERFPLIKTIALAARNQDAYLANIINGGAYGLIPKTESPQILLDAIRRAADGGIIYSKDQLALAQHWQDVAGCKWDSLSKQQRQILLLLAQGLCNKSIAKKLRLTLKAIEYHVCKINKKLGVASRQEAIVWLYKYIPDCFEKLPD